MTVPFWPPELPQRVLRDGFSLGAADGRLSTKTDAGPPKVRRRFSAAVRPLQAAFVILADDVARFDRFWAEQIGGGSLPFLLPDQITDGLMITDGDGAANSKPTYAIQGFRNQATPDGAVPLVLGRIRFAPRYAMLPVTEAIGDLRFVTAAFLCGYTGDLKINKMTGSGNAFACVNWNGQLFRSATACN